MANPSSEALEAVKKLTIQINPRDLRSIVTLLGNDSIQQLITRIESRPEEFGKHEMVIVELLKELKPDLCKSLELLTKEIYSNTENLLYKYIPLD